MGWFHWPTFNLTLTLFGAQLIISIYQGYYVKVFVEEYHMSGTTLATIQSIFMFWNAFNDPLLGYLQDLGCCGVRILTDRRKVVIYGGPIFAASFVLFWFPWSTIDDSISFTHITVSSFIYEALFTLILATYCSLCVETTDNNRDRVRAMTYQEAAVIISAMLLYPLEFQSHMKEDFWVFQAFTVILAIVAGASMIVSGYNMKIGKASNENIKLTNQEEAQQEMEKKTTWQKIETVWQIAKAPRFLCLCVAHFLKVIRFMISEMFLLIFTEGLLVNQKFFSADSGLLSLFYFSARSSGSVLFLILQSLLSKHGPHRVILVLNVITIFCAVPTWIAGSDNVIAIACFIMLENTIGRCGWQSYYIVIGGEVVDADMRRHKRKFPLSSLIFTSKAFIVKFADQLAYIICAALILQNTGYPEIVSSCDSLHHNNATEVVMSNSTIYGTTTQKEFPTADCLYYEQTLLMGLEAFPIICAVGESLIVVLDLAIKRREAASLSE